MKLSRRSSLSLMAGAALAMPYISRARAQEEAVLNVFNWTDYIGETTIEDFQTATGIQVAYDLYDSTEAMEAKMLAGSSGFDVVLQAGSTLERLRHALATQGATQIQWLKNLRCGAIILNTRGAELNKNVSENI